MIYFRKLLLVVAIVMVLTTVCMGRKKTKKLKRGALQVKETNPLHFIRLLVMRLIYGIATRFGFGENISEALNGAFVPPGVDYDDYGDLDISDREDYDY